MKVLKLILIGILTFPIISIAQEYDNSSKFPQQGNFMIELNTNPFGKDKVFEFQKLSTKLWIGDRTLLRLGLEFDTKKNEANDDYSANNNYISFGTEKTTMFGVNPGFEYRILENSKISPYIGLEGFYRTRSANAEYKNTFKHEEGYQTNSTNKIEGSWIKEEYLSGSGNSFITTYPERAYNSFGGNIILGTDFYFIKNLYFGFEVGIGYETIKYKKIESDFSQWRTQGGSGSEYENTQRTLIASENSSKFAFYNNGLIRLGVWF